MLVMKILTFVPNATLESYLYEPVETHSVSSSDNSEDDDSQDSQRLLSTTWHKM